MSDYDTAPGPSRPISRRSAIGLTLLAGAAFLAAHPMSAQEPRSPAALKAQAYDMKKSITLFYPQKMTWAVSSAGERCRLRRHRAELRLESDLSPVAGTKEFQQIRNAADRIGIVISGVCSFLFWPYLLSSNDPRSARVASNWPAAWRRRLTTSAWRICWSCLGPCTSLARRSRARAE